MVKSEIFLLTFRPLTLPLPHWGEGKGEGKCQLFLARFSFVRKKSFDGFKENE
jgi:hypothetical protein